MGRTAILLLILGLWTGCKGGTTPVDPFATYGPVRVPPPATGSARRADSYYQGTLSASNTTGNSTQQLAAQGLPCKTAVHICYGYGIKQNTDWKATLGSEWRQYENTFPLLQASRIDQVSLECHNSKVPMALMDLLKGKDVLVGSIDVTTHRIETPQEVAATIRKALAYVAPEKLYPCTNCGMVPLPRKVAREKIKALTAGAALIRNELA